MRCQACGTWTCTTCSWQRHGASLDRPELQDCARCGSTDGTFRATRHQAGRGIWNEHNPAGGPLCEVWADTMFGYLCKHESCRTIARGR
jgi:hypothetical protein